MIQRRCAWAATTPLAFASVFLSSPGLGQRTPHATDSVSLRYQKYEYTIPMRDGVPLFTAAYVPRDTAHSYPILLMRTPYGVGPYGADAYPAVLRPGLEFERAGYVFVYQDVRGRFRSGGRFIQMTPQRDVRRGPRDVDESTDAYDTIDWLIHHIPHNNGRVGLWGISYPGFYAAAGAIDAHPALKAVSPQAPQADWFLGDDVHHNGALVLTGAFNWMDWMAICGRQARNASVPCGEAFDFGTPDGYTFFLGLGSLANADARYFRGQVPLWTELMDHGTYDAFWQSRDLLPHLKSIRPAILCVGGWYDANNLYGSLHVYESILKQSPRTEATLVVGPWYHGQWEGDGDSINALHFGSNTAAFFRSTIQFPFFEHYLRTGAPLALPRAYVFETGANAWRTLDQWPPASARPESLYFQPRGRLSTAPPAPADSGSAYDSYLSDPAHPVPYVPGLSTHLEPDYMSQDQRFAATRPDVVVYESAPLDADLTIAGPVVPNLYVSASGTDADWVVKLIDVHPEVPAEQRSAKETRIHLDVKRTPVLCCAEQTNAMRGFQELVRGDVLRAKFRESVEHPAPLTPDEPTHIAFTMPDVMHTFKRGHRIMVQVQSSWFPLVDRNPQQFEDIYHAADMDFRVATLHVYHSAARPSSVIVSVPRSQ